MTPALRHGLRNLCLAAMILCAPWLAQASEYHGRVLFGGFPVPGATVTLVRGTSTLSTVTDTLGIYEFPNLPDGDWTIHIELRGFAKVDGTVKVAPDAAQGEWPLKLLSLDELLTETHAAPVTVAPLKPRVIEPATPGKPKQEQAAAPPAAAASEDNSERASDGLLINGSENNAATSPFSLAPAFGNRRAGAKSLYNGGIGAIADNSIFDARPYSLTGQQEPKDIYNRITMLATLGGPLKIPHLLYHGPNFFIAYQWTRNRTAANATGLVPDAAERDGNLSGVLNAQGQPISIYNPATGLPYTGMIPVNPVAQALLALYPLPNLAGNSSYNYQTELLTNTHQDAFQSRLDKSIGRRDEVYGGFGFQSTRSDNANLFNFRDTTDTLGIDTYANWQHRYQHQIFVVLGYHFTRQRTEVTPEFAYRQNISLQDGVTGNGQDAADWGPPALVFSSGIAELGDANSEFNRNRTDASSAKAFTTRGHHTYTVGIDFRRQEFNQLSQANPRGVFTFTGAATSATGSTSATSGSDLADFLFGVPDTSSLAYGNADKYFRQSVYDLYASDDWRLRPELTINAGLRWEYGAPLTELFGRLVNLDIAPGFTSEAPVLGSDPKGSVTGGSYPTSLIRPDKRGIEPRVGISWRPIPASTLVVRAGYGIYYDSSVYLSSAESMSQQAPLSTSLSVSNSSNCRLTLANGFRNCAGTTADSFAVDPNLRVGYAQTWQISAQRDLPAALVGTVTYAGNKGTRGMQEFLPNTYPIGATTPCSSCPVGFVYRTSNGNSTRESGSVQLRRRLRSGITASLQYTYSKSLDDDAQVGSQGHVVAGSSSSGSPVIAQNWLNLNAERELSSFDQRHVLTAQAQYTSGMGKGGGTLLTGWRGRVLKEWTVLAKLNAASGLPETPVYLAAVPGTGVTGTIRPSATGAPIRVNAGGYYLNAVAYTAPTSGQWGNARRDSIPGPDQFGLDGSLARTFRLHDPFNLDVRFDATNLLNHAVFTSWITTTNSTTFGLPASVNAMRSMVITGRLRF